MENPALRFQNLLTNTDLTNYTRNLGQITTSGDEETEWTQEDWDKIYRSAVEVSYPEVTPLEIKLIAAHKFLEYLSGTPFKKEQYIEIFGVMMSTMGITWESLTGMEYEDELETFLKPDAHIPDFPIAMGNSSGGTQEIIGYHGRINLRENSEQLALLCGVIADIEQNPEQHEAEMKMLFFGLSYYMGLILRYNKRDEANVNHIIADRSAKILSSLVKWPWGPLPMMSLAFRKRFETIFTSESDGYYELLSVVVVGKLEIPKPETQLFLKASCTQALGENGLGAIAWFAKMVQKLQIQPSQQMELLALFGNDMTGPSALKIIEFMTSPRAKGWPFCRLFKNTAHNKLSTKDNPAFVQTCILIAEGNRAPEILENLKLDQITTQQSPIQSLAETIISRYSRKALGNVWPIAREIEAEFQARLQENQANARRSGSLFARPYFNQNRQPQSDNSGSGDGEVEV